VTFIYRIALAAGWDQARGPLNTDAVVEVRAL
jgi:hypothetical protein